MFSFAGFCLEGQHSLYWRGLLYLVNKTTILAVLHRATIRQILSSMSEENFIALFISSGNEKSASLEIKSGKKVFSDMIQKRGPVYSTF